MSQRAIEFANRWVHENVNPNGYGPEDGPNVEAIEGTERLIAAAEEAGIPREELEEDLGDISDFVHAAYEEANDVEVDRRANKDD